MLPLVDGWPRCTIEDVYAGLCCHAAETGTSLSVVAGDVLKDDL
ncbi:hypothetical protein [Actinoplanes couchii]|nr:hypothetical protein [Actinoplanes couchii]MDR6318837.1 hypothetical protein [Actinoplanes couchii]